MGMIWKSSKAEGFTGPCHCIYWLSGVRGACSNSSGGVTGHQVRRQLLLLCNHPSIDRPALSIGASSSRFFESTKLSNPETTTGAECIYVTDGKFFYPAPMVPSFMISPTAHFYLNDTTIFLSVSSMTLCFLMITSLQVRTRSAKRPDQIYTSTDKVPHCRIYRRTRQSLQGKVPYLQFCQWKKSWSLLPLLCSIPLWCGIPPSLFPIQIFHSFLAHKATVASNQQRPFSESSRSTISNVIVFNLSHLAIDSSHYLPIFFY